MRSKARSDEVWVEQFETPIETTHALLMQARQAGARTVLNLEPFVPHPVRMLKCVDVAVLNEIELAQATGSRLRGSSSRRIVGEASKQGVALHELPLQAMQEVEPKISAEALRVLSVEASVKSRTSFGGTAPKNVAAQAKSWLKRLEKERKLG